jgi:hypothetical protein
MTLVKLSIKSGNTKTGHMPVSMSEPKTCPSSCPWKDSGCYAKYHFLGKHWKNVEKNGNNFQSFCEQVKNNIKDNSIWRHNQCGDLPGISNKINMKELSMLVEANKGKKGFTYTHKPLTQENKKAIKKANDNGFTINLSADSLKHADELKQQNIGPVVVILPENAPNKTITPKGNTVVKCLKQQNENKTCLDCQWCQKKDRKFIVGFAAHGVGKKSMSLKVIQ